MDKTTLPFIKENLQLEEDRINLEKLENPTTNEDEDELIAFLESKKGKIYFYVEEKIIDRTWKIIREETLSGKLGTEARAMTVKEKNETNNKRYRIRIYSKDIQDKKDIARILERLLELGF